MPFVTQGFYTFEFEFDLFKWETGVVYISKFLGKVIIIYAWIFIVFTFTPIGKIQFGLQGETKNCFILQKKKKKQGVRLTPEMLLPLRCKEGRPVPLNVKQDCVKLNQKYLSDYSKSLLLIVT